MSFNIDLEQQQPFSDSPEFDRLAEEASNIVLDVNNHLVTLQKQLTTLRTKKQLASSEAVSGKCVRSIEQLTRMFRLLGGTVKEMGAYDVINPSQAFTRDKVTRELRRSLHEFQEAQDTFTSLTMTIKDEAQAALEQHAEQQQQQLIPQSNESQQLVLEQDVINNEEFVYQQSLIREREEEIQNIEHGIQELNEIFNDLGSIVQEQGTLVDNIESNIYEISNSTRDAAGQLNKALRYQRRSGRKTLCLLMIVCVILGIVLLGIFL